MEIFFCDLNRKKFLFYYKMSCTSTRTFHSLCNNGCTTSCPCAPTSAFSFRPLCPCPELQDNVFNNAANDYCKVFNNIFEENPATFLNILESLSDPNDIGTNINTVDPRFQTILDKHCKIFFTLINTGNAPCTLLTFTIENKILIANTFNTNCLPFSGNNFIFQVNNVDCIVANNR
jgi:hypothetical protein